MLKCFYKQLYWLVDLKASFYLSDASAFLSVLKVNEYKHDFDTHYVCFLVQVCKSARMQKYKDVISQWLLLL